MPPRGRITGDGWKSIPDESLSCFARWLRDYLGTSKRFGMSLAELSRATNGQLSAQAMLKWFQSKHARPREDSVRLVAQALQVPADDLLRLAGYLQGERALLDGLERDIREEANLSDVTRQSLLSAIAEARSRDDAARAREGGALCMAR